MFDVLSGDAIFGVSEEHKALREMVRGFARKELEPKASFLVPRLNSESCRFLKPENGLIGQENGRPAVLQNSDCILGTTDVVQGYRGPLVLIGSLDLNVALNRYELGRPFLT